MIVINLFTELGNRCCTFLRGKHRCPTALVHDPSNQPVLGHPVDVNSTAARRQRFDFLLRMQRARGYDVRQILVTFDRHAVNHLRIEESFFVRGRNNLRIGFEALTERNHTPHARQHQSSHPVPHMAESLGVPHPIEENQRMRFEVARRLLSLAARIVDPAEFVRLPRVEERHENRRIDPASVGRHDDQRIHLRGIEEARIVVREQIIHRGANPFAHRFGEDVLGNPRAQYCRQHFRVIVDLRTGEIPIAAREAVAVVRPIEAERSPEFFLEQPDVPRNRLRGAGEVEVLLDVSTAHLVSEIDAVGVAVLLELGNQPDQALQLFFAEGHEDPSPQRFSYCFALI